MSSTTCETCKGYGTVCGRCGKARKRQVRNWYGTACCYRAKIKRCPSHTPTAYACDVCLEPAPEVKWSNVANVGGGWRDACPACVMAWEHWLAVSSDRFLETRGNAPELDAIRRAVDVEHVRSVAFVAGFSRTIADQLAGHLSQRLPAQPRGSVLVVSVDEAATVDKAFGLVTPSSGAPDPVG